MEEPGQEKDLACRTFHRRFASLPIEGGIEGGGWAVSTAGAAYPLHYWSVEDYSPTVTLASENSSPLGLLS